MSRAALLLGLGAALAAAQDYILKSVVLDGGGGRATATDYVAGFSAAQTAASGWLASAGYRAVLGFWHADYASGAVEQEGMTPDALRFTLRAGQNPVRARAVIRYSLPAEADVSLKVLDRSGRVVGTLVQARQGRGVFRVNWDFSAVPQSQLCSGVYFLRLAASGATLVEKLVLAR